MKGRFGRGTDRVVCLRPLTPADLPTAATWFDDGETRAHLGGRDWPGRMLDLGAQTVGTEFRGALQTGAYQFLAEWDDRPVGYIDCGVFDRWTEYGGEGGDGPIIRQAMEVPTGSIAYVVAPEVRNQGLGRTMIGELVARPELSEVRLFEAGVDPGNVASIRCLVAAGFRPVRSEPDYEGMLYFTLLR